MKTLTAKTLLALFAASLLTTAVADDQSKEHKNMRSADAKFDQLDRDHDKRLSRAEAQKDDSLSAEFASIDQNSDGFVSKAEYTAQLGNMHKDTNPESERPYR